MGWGGQRGGRAGRKSSLRKDVHCGGPTFSTAVKDKADGKKKATQWVLGDIRDGLKDT